MTGPRPERIVASTTPHIDEAHAAARRAGDEDHARKNPVDTVRLKEDMMDDKRTAMRMGDMSREALGTRAGHDLARAADVMTKVESARADTLAAVRKGKIPAKS